MGAYLPGMFLGEQDPIHLSESDSEDTFADLHQHSAEASFSFSCRLPHSPADYIHVRVMFKCFMSLHNRPLLTQTVVEKESVSSLEISL